MTRYVAPAGAPIRLGDLARWTGSTLSRRDVEQTLRETLGQTFGVRHSVLTSTGRAGMTLLLRAMRRLAPPDRLEVIVPSYTCYSVAASIVKAGLRPRLVDISPVTLDYDRAALAATDSSRALAMIATNLYGLPGDLAAHTRLARDGGFFLIDDAAQSMGATVGGRWSGTWGDAGLFSFDKGKPVSGIDGGAVVTNNDDLAKALAAETADLPRPALAHSGVNVVKALAYFALLRPWLYWIPNRIPQLELGKTVFTTDYPLERPDRVLAALAISALGHLDEYTRIRVTNAQALLGRLSSLAGVQTIAVRTDATPGYLRAPVLVRDAALRPRVIEALRQAGIGATGSYPASLADVAELAPFLLQPHPAAEGGRYVADRIVTLPTHPFVSPADLARTIATLESSLAASRPAQTALRSGNQPCAE